MSIASFKEKLAASGVTQAYGQVVPTVKGRWAHMDGDYAAYYCSGKDGTCPGDARYNVMSRVAKLKNFTGCEQLVMHLTHPMSNKGNRFLSATVKPYQGQRGGSRKPENWAHLREFLENYDGKEFVVRLWSDREADDGVAYMVENKLCTTGISDVIHTRDKDFRMFAGTHCTWENFQIVDVPLGCYDIVHDGLQYGHKWFWTQMIQGDTVDHIPGIPRMGEVAAVELLHGTTNNDEARGLVLGAYLNKYGEDEYLDRVVEQAHLLWMRTDMHALDVDFLKVFLCTPRLMDAVGRLQERIEHVGRNGRSC